MSLMELLQFRVQQFGDVDLRKTDHLVKMANKVLRGIKCGEVRRFRTQISKGWVYGSGVKSYQLLSFRAQGFQDF